MILKINNMYKSYGINSVLENINLQVSDKDKIGLIGINGSGKTTLLKCIVGTEDIDSGSIIFNSNIKIGYLSQDHSFPENQTVYEAALSMYSRAFDIERKMKSLEKEMELFSDNCNKLNEILEQYEFLHQKFEDLGGLSYKSEIKGVLNGLNIKDERYSDLISSLSGGEKSRLKLGLILISKPELLILDEPTNHLDIDSLEYLERFLLKYNSAVIVISHDRYFLNKVTNKIALLENKNIRVYNTNYDAFVERRQKELDIEIRAYNNQQEEIKRQKDIISRLSKYGKRSIIQAMSRQKKLDKMSILEKPKKDSTDIHLNFDVHKISGEEIIICKNLSKSYDNKVIFKDLNFNIYRGDKIGLVGRNGVGKTTLFKILSKKDKKTSGDINYGSSVKLDYFDQEGRDLNFNLNLIEDIREKYPHMTDLEIRNSLATLGFYGEEVFKKISELSGGEKARVSLLKILLNRTNTLLLDEPTNHLDLESKECLENALKDYQGTLFIISHDRYFLDQVANKIFELDSEGIKEYDGNYTYYKNEKYKKYLQNQIDTGLATSEEIDRYKEIFGIDYINITSKKIEKNQSKNTATFLNKKIKRQKEARLREITKEIDIIEEEIQELKEQLLIPEVYLDYQKVNDINKLIESNEFKLSSLLDEWTELEDV